MTIIEYLHAKSDWKYKICVESDPDKKADLEEAYADWLLAVRVAK